jgi:two-component system cell cycle sensor histidine kinase/response regulator CckA
MHPTQSTVEDAANILEAVQEAYVRLDSELRFTFINRAAEILLAAPRADSIGKTPWDVHPETAGTPLELGFRRALAERTTVMFEHYYDARQRWYGLTATPDANGGLIVHYSDITDSKQGVAGGERMEDALRKSEEKFSKAFRSSPAAVTIADISEGRFIDVNEAFERVTGYRRDEAIGRTAHELEIWADPHDREETIRQLSAVGRIRNVEYRFRSKDGAMGTGLISAELIELDGKPCAIAATIDITERKQIEQRLNTLATAIEQAGEQIVITDLDGVIQYCNPAFERITGYSKEEAVGAHPSLLKSGKHNTDFYDELWTTITNGEVWTGHFLNKKKDGSLYEEDATISPIRGASGKITGFVAVKRDVTQTLELMRQLLQSQKLESIGRLAGGVAHDFNNLLTVINGYSDFLITSLDRTHPLWSSADEIRKAGERAASLTKQLLAFSRKQVIEPRPLDLNTTIRGSEQMLQRLIGEDITLTARLDPFLGQVMADPEQIHQVILNLVINARDAMPSGGRLDITTENVEVTSEEASIQPDAKMGRYVMMIVTDSGTGMDENTRQRIFEPFFTTKERDKGTGLGLATVYGVVRQNGGWISVSSEPRVGTSFKLCFPRIDGRVVEEQREVSRAEGYTAARPFWWSRTKKQSAASPGRC